jgi:hypothetical protein
VGYFVCINKKCGTRLITLVIDIGWIAYLQKIEILFLIFVYEQYNYICFIMAPNLNQTKDFGKTLPNKYTKLMHFGFWLLSRADISDEERNTIFEKLCLFADVEDQTCFYENFYEKEKEIAKSMRKFSADKIKEQRKLHVIKDMILPKGRDQILRDAFIDSIIAAFNRDRANI